MKKPDLSKKKLIWRRDNTGNIDSYNIIEIDEKGNKTTLFNVENTCTITPLKITRNIIIDSTLQYKITDNIIGKSIYIVDSNGNKINYSYNSKLNIINFKEEDMNKVVFIYINVDAITKDITTKENCRYIIVPVYNKYCKTYGHSIVRY